MAGASSGNAVVVEAEQCDFKTGVMNGEGVEARLLEDMMLAVGVAFGAGTLAEGNDGCAGVASSCAEKSVHAAEARVAVFAPLRVHLLQRCDGPDAVKQALWKLRWQIVQVARSESFRTIRTQQTGHSLVAI